MFLSIFKMIDSQNPTLRLEVAPIFLVSNVPSLDVVLTIESPTVERGSALVVSTQAVKSGIPLPEIKPVDDERKLPILLDISSENGYCSWAAG